MTRFPIRLGAGIVALAALMALWLADAAHGAIPSFHLLGTPKLYVVRGDVSPGRPTAYVMFRTAQHLHEPRLVVPKIHGVGGRTYASRHDRLANCYRSVSFFVKSTGTPGRLKAGNVYTVRFVVRSSAHGPTNGPAVTTRRLAANAFTPRAPLAAPSC